MLKPGSLGSVHIWIWTTTIRYQEQAPLNIQETEVFVHGPTSVGEHQGFLEKNLGGTSSLDDQSEMDYSFESYMNTSEESKATAEEQAESDEEVGEGNTRQCLRRGVRKSIHPLDHVCA